jgi:hypothetical protein
MAHLLRLLPMAALAAPVVARTSPRCSTPWPRHQSRTASRWASEPALAVLRIGSGPAGEATFVHGELSAEVDGSSLHASVRVRQGDRDRLERLCRYVAGPALSTERLSLSKQGNVLLHLRRPWRDGTKGLPAWVGRPGATHIHRAPLW